MNNLSLFNIARMNLKRQPIRTAFLSFLIFSLSFVLFFGTFLMKSLNCGLSSLSDRLGADIIVVPQGYDTKIEGALLRGEPNTFYFDISAVEWFKLLHNFLLQLFLQGVARFHCK